MNTDQFKRYLASHGTTFKTKPGGSGHLIAIRGDKVTDFPVHGGSKQLGTGLVNAIKKQLGVK